MQKHTALEPERLWEFIGFRSLIFQAESFGAKGLGIFSKPRSHGLLGP